jgi:hypothetical protein
MVGPSVPPEVLEALRREGGVAHGRGNRPMSQIVLGSVVSAGCSLVGNAVK